jgi:hypothetical protein
LCAFIEPQVGKTKSRNETQRNNASGEKKNTLFGASWLRLKTRGFQEPPCNNSRKGKKKKGVGVFFPRKSG